METRMLCLDVAIPSTQHSKHKDVFRFSSLFFWGFFSSKHIHISIFPIETYNFRNTVEVVPKFINVSSVSSSPFLSYHLTQSVNLSFIQFIHSSIDRVVCFRNNTQEYPEKNVALRGHGNVLNQMMWNVLHYIYIWLAVIAFNIFSNVHMLRDTYVLHTCYVPYTCLRFFFPFIQMKSNKWNFRFRIRCAVRPAAATHTVW